MCTKASILTFGTWGRVVVFVPLLKKKRAEKKKHDHGYMILHGSSLLKFCPTPSKRCPAQCPCTFMRFFEIHPPAANGQLVTNLINETAERGHSLNSSVLFSRASSHKWRRAGSHLSAARRETPPHGGWVRGARERSQFPVRFRARGAQSRWWVMKPSTCSWPNTDIECSWMCVDVIQCAPQLAAQKVS